jgi:hypothetical protein
MRVIGGFTADVNVDDLIGHANMTGMIKLQLIPGSARAFPAPT